MFIAAAFSRSLQVPAMLMAVDLFLTSDCCRILFIAGGRYIVSGV
jgi:hypothetical protein